MITTLTALLASKYGKYALEVLLVAGLVFGAYKWAEHKGRTAQKDADNQQQSQEIEASRREAKEATALLVKQANDRADAAERDRNSARIEFAQFAATLQGLAIKEQGAKEQVNKLADSELHADVTQKLAIRAATDKTACYLPQEERAIDDAITQYPLCQQDRTALAGQVAAKGKEVQAAADLAAARQTAIEASAKYTAQLEHDYKQLFDQHPPRYRSGKCIWLWKCGKRQTSIGRPA